MDVRKLYDEGWKYLKKGKYEEALKCFDKVIEYYEKKLRIKSDEDYNNLKLKDLIKKDTNLFLKAWLNKGRIFRKLGDFEKALKCFDKALQINPNDRDTWSIKGYTLRKLGKYKEAIKCFDKVLSIFPNNTVALDGKGYVYYSLCEYEKAIKYFEKSLKIDNSNVYALNGLGYIYAYRKEYDQAIEYFNKSLKIDGSNIYALNGLGHVFSNRGEYEKAIEHFEKVWEIDPKFYDSINTIHEYLKNEISDDKKFKKIFELLRKIAFYIIAFKNRLIVVDKKIIYHYTKPNVIINILESEDSYFRLYNARYMNDPEEGKAFLRVILNNKFTYLKKIFGISKEEDINNFKENEEIQTFIGSFVVDGDNLFLWRTYGKDENKEEAKGICIGIIKGFFDDIPDHFETLKNKELFYLYYVIYEDDDKYEELNKILSKIDILIGRLFKLKRTNKKEKEIIKRIIRSLLDEIRYLVKSKHYKEEKECRVIKVYNLKIHKNDKIKLDKNHTPPKLYIEIEKDLREYIKEIILGPRLENLEAWEAYLNYHLHDYNIEIKRSNCKFR